MHTEAIRTEGLQLAYEQKIVLENMSLTIEEGEIFTILGPNGCGKSTLLKALTGNLRPQAGRILLYGKEVAGLTVRELASLAAFLPQNPEIPADMTAYELVACGRFPYQHWWKGVSTMDKAVIQRVMAQTHTEELRDRPVASLSGGERQRVWIAMALAQEPQVLLLDEPTTYLDICHQLEILELLQRLNKETGLTVVMVLHDINHAAKYSRRIAVLCRGVLEALGTPGEVITPALLEKVFRVHADVDVATYERPNCVITGLAHTL